MKLLEDLMLRREAERLREIESLQLRGLSTWAEDREALCIRRRRALRDVRGRERLQGYLVPSR